MPSNRESRKKEEITSQSQSVFRFLHTTRNERIFSVVPLILFRVFFGLTTLGLYLLVTSLHFPPQLALYHANCLWKIAFSVGSDNKWISRRKQVLLVERTRNGGKLNYSDDWGVCESPGVFILFANFLKSSTFFWFVNQKQVYTFRGKRREDRGIFWRSGRWNEELKKIQYFFRV